MKQCKTSTKMKKRGTLSVRIYKHLEAIGMKNHRQVRKRHTIHHRRRGTTANFVQLRNSGVGALASFLAVLGPGLLGGLSDDDPAGITPYSLLGAEQG